MSCGNSYKLQDKRLLRSIAAAGLRYVVVCAAIVLVWIAYYCLIRWLTADCWFMRIDIQAAKEKRCDVIPATQGFHCAKHKNV